MERIGLSGLYRNQILHTHEDQWSQFVLEALDKGYRQKNSVNKSSLGQTRITLSKFPQLPLIFATLVVVIVF